MTRTSRFTPEEALAYHFQPVPGKFEITPSKPMATQRDLSLAYSPGVAVPVEAIAGNPGLAYDYTTKGNLVAVVSNGTAILGPWQSWRAGIQAGDGGQGGAVQALCRCQRHRHRAGIPRMLMRSSRRSA
jgi:hypothetical protein